MDLIYLMIEKVKATKNTRKRFIPPEGILLVDNTV